jgi:hypothetical protein
MSIPVKVRMHFSTDELCTLEEVLGYFVSAAGPDGSFGGGGANESEEETFDNAKALLDRVSNILEAKGI